MEKSMRANVDESFDDVAVVDIPAYMTVVEFAERFRLSRSMTYQLMSDGHLRSVTIGRSRRIPRAAVLEFEASLDGGTL